MSIIISPDLGEQEIFSVTSSVMGLSTKRLNKLKGHLKTQHLDSEGQPRPHTGVHART